MSDALRICESMRNNNTHTETVKLPSFGYMRIRFRSVCLCVSAKHFDARIIVIIRTISFISPVESVYWQLAMNIFSLVVDLLIYQWSLPSISISLLTQSISFSRWTFQATIRLSFVVYSVDQTLNSVSLKISD